jgi:excisionase family DNA binding protein
MTITTTGAPPATGRYLNVRDAATYLSLTTRALYHRVDRRTVPFIKRGHRVWFDRVALDRWMRDGAVDPDVRS